jgi:dephospho-CoA kinase
MRMGLTGGIGSGKSTLARMLGQAGAVIVDADLISRGMTLAGGLAMPAIEKEFGSAFVAPDGAMARGLMRQLVFDEPAARLRLQAIIHPLVGQETECQAGQAFAAGARCVVFDIPLLVESKHWRAQLDQVLVVDCREETQIARVLARETALGNSAGWDRAMVEKVMTGQSSRAARLAAADASIYNDDLSLQDLAMLVSQILPRLGL